jgi:acyl-CoA hydrolase
VAVDADGRPVPVPPIQTETEFEGLRFEQAAERRDARLELSRKTLELNKLNSSRK